MPGRNCAFFGCPTSQKHKLSLFQIPGVSAKQSEYTAAIKKKSREEWLKIILRTREMTRELKTRIHNNNIYVCKHQKAAKVLLATLAVQTGSTKLEKRRNCLCRLGSE